MRALLGRLEMEGQTPLPTVTVRKRGLSIQDLMFVARQQLGKKRRPSDRPSGSAPIRFLVRPCGPASSPGRPPGPAPAPAPGAPDPPGLHRGSIPKRGRPPGRRTVSTPAPAPGSTPEPVPGSSPGRTPRPTHGTAPAQSPTFSEPSASRMTPDSSDAQQRVRSTEVRSRQTMGLNSPRFPRFLWRHGGCGMAVGVTPYESGAGGAG